MKKVFMLTLVLASFACKKEKNRVRSIYEKPGYAIGSVSSFISLPFSTTYNYNYTAKGTSFSGKYKSRGIGQDDDRNLDRDFLVVYDTTNAAESHLNMGIIIDSQQEFDSLLLVFKTNPPKP